MRFLSTLLLALALIPVSAAAEKTPLMEFGTNMGMTVLSTSGSSVTLFSIPGAGIGGMSQVYATIFTSNGIIIEPQLGFTHISSEGNSLSHTQVGLTAGYLFQGASMTSLYLAVSLALQAYSGSDINGDSEGAFGGKAGVRIPVGDGNIGTRLEIGFRRWTDSEVNELTIGFGLGGVLKK